MNWAIETIAMVHRGLLGESRKNTRDSSIIESEKGTANRFSDHFWAKSWSQKEEFSLKPITPTKDIRLHDKPPNVYRVATPAKLEKQINPFPAKGFPIDE